MQTRAVESAADVRDVGQRVKIAEHTEAVDEDDVRVGQVGRI